MPAGKIFALLIAAILWHQLMLWRPERMSALKSLLASNPSRWGNWLFGGGEFWWERAEARCIRVPSACGCSKELCPASMNPLIFTGTIHSEAAFGSAA